MKRPAPFTSEDVTVVRHSPWVLALTLVPFLVTILCGLAGAVHLPAGLLGITALLPFVAYHRSWLSRRARARVRATADGLTIGDRLYADLRGGVVVPGDPVRVRLRRAGFPVEIETGTVDEARALLRALGLDATQAVATFQLRAGIEPWTASYNRWMAAVVTFVGAIAVAAHGMWLLPLLSILVGVIVVLDFIPTRLCVGADGVELRWLWLRRHLAYREMASVKRSERGKIGTRSLRFEMRSGEVRVPFRSDEAGEGAVVEERIREAMEAFHDADSADPALLRRGKRTLRDWVTALRALGAGANATHRTAPFPRERLFRIVEDPSADPADRAAAAVALGEGLDDESRDRLRAAVGATVAPRLRIAIEKAAGGESEAELEAALAELEAGPQEARRA